jgi:hypothetical protein
MLRVGSDLPAIPVRLIEDVVARKRNLKALLTALEPLCLVTLERFYTSSADSL